MDKFNLVFSGQVATAADLERAKLGVQRLFNANAQLLEQLFSGRPVVIKRDLDQQAAQKYQQAFAAVGAILHVQSSAAAAAATPAPPAPAPVDTPAPAPVAAAVAPATAAPAREAAPAPTVTPSENTPIAPRDEYMAAFSHVEAPNFDIAPTGTDLMDAAQELPIPEVDISALSLAPAGSDMGQLARDEEVVIPDISHLSLNDD